MNTPNPILELRAFIEGSIFLARSKRLFAELLGWEAAEDIAADIVAHERAIVATTHKAETYDREALAAMDAATDPKSDGGVNITPNEARRIRPFIAKSAELDHDASELAHV